MNIIYFPKRVIFKYIQRIMNLLNKNQDWTLIKDYYYQLLSHLGQQAGFKQVKFWIKSKIFLLDSSTISLCLSLFDWAKYKTAKGAIKMHSLLD